MCGIAGFFGKNKYLPTNQNFKKCLDIMHNRGPDAKGQISKNFKNQSLVFLHSRLSIIDLTKDSNQPFEDENGILKRRGWSWRRRAEPVTVVVLVPVLGVLWVFLGYVTDSKCFGVFRGCVGHVLGTF